MIATESDNSCFSSLLIELFSISAFIFADSVASILCSSSAFCI